MALSFLLAFGDVESYSPLKVVRKFSWFKLFQPMINYTSCSSNVDVANQHMSDSISEKQAASQNPTLQEIIKINSVTA